MRRLIPLILTLLMLGAVFAIPPDQQAAPQQQPQTKEQTVYATRTGKKYSSSHLPLPVPEQDPHFAERCKGAGIDSL
jgi:hypothetical protein